MHLQPDLSDVNRYHEVIFIRMLAHEKTDGHKFQSKEINFCFWSDCKAIPAYGMIFIIG